MHRKQGKCLSRHLGLVCARFVGPGEDCQDLGKKWACACHFMTGTGDGDDKLRGWAYTLRAAGAVLTQASPVNQVCIQLVM